MVWDFWRQLASQLAELNYPNAEVALFAKGQSEPIQLWNPLDKVEDCDWRQGDEKRDGIYWQQLSCGQRVRCMALALPGELGYLRIRLLRQKGKSSGSPRQADSGPLQLLMQPLFNPAHKEIDHSQVKGEVQAFGKEQDLAKGKQELQKLPVQDKELLVRGLEERGLLKSEEALQQLADKMELPLETVHQMMQRPHELQASTAMVEQPVSWKASLAEEVMDKQALVELVKGCTEGLQAAWKDLLSQVDFEPLALLNAVSISTQAAVGREIATVQDPKGSASLDALRINGLMAVLLKQLQKILAKGKPGQVSLVNIDLKAFLEMTKLEMESEMSLEKAELFPGLRAGKDAALDGPIIREHSAGNLQGPSV